MGNAEECTAHSESTHIPVSFALECFYWLELLVLVLCVHSHVVSRRFCYCFRTVWAAFWHLKVTSPTRSVERLEEISSGSMRIKIEKISRNYARDFERASEWMNDSNYISGIWSSSKWSRYKWMKVLKFECGNTFARPPITCQFTVILVFLSCSISLFLALFAYMKLPLTFFLLFSINKSFCAICFPLLLFYFAFDSNRFQCAFR